MTDALHEQAIVLFRQVHMAKQEWEKVVDTLGDVVLIVDAHNRITRCNKALAELTGISFQGLLGRNWEELFTELQCRVTEQQEDGVEFLHPASGRTFFYQRYPSDPALGEASASILTLHDITRHKQLTAALERKNQEVVHNHRRLQEALDAVSCMIREVVERGEVIAHGNASLPADLRACWEVLQCGSEECPCYGQAAMRCWHMAGTHCHARMQGDFMQKFSLCETCSYYLDVVADPIRRIGEEFNHMLLLLREKSRALSDAYEQLKESQAQLLQQEKMASIGQLAAGVAHEINNPMGFVTSNLSTLAKYFTRIGEFLGRQSDLLGTVACSEDVVALARLREALKIDHILKDVPALIGESLEGADRVRTIVRNLKSFSRVDEHAGEVEADINQCLEETINIVCNQLQQKCTVVRQYGELPLLRCHPRQLNQVFMNLLVNAAQAIASQGVITIVTWVEAGEIRVSINDTGDGIALENRSRLFEPFFTTREVGKGTGLGLSISYDIVKQHQGRIEVESSPGRGATFTVCLPLQNQAS